MIILGIAGPHRSGKGTAAEIIRAAQASAVVLSFADPIKKMLVAGGILSPDQVHGDKKTKRDPRYNRTPREIMQTLGTEWGRGKVCGDIWRQKMLERLENERAAVAIIPDVYTEREAELIRGRGTLLHIKGRTEYKAKHQTQAPLKIDRDLDMVILNDGSPVEFEANILEAVRDVIPPQATTCRAYQTADSIYCPCGMTWDADDTAPTCPILNDRPRISYPDPDQ